MKKIIKTLKAITVDFYKYMVIDFVEDMDGLTLFGKFFMFIMLSIIMLPMIILAIPLIPLWVVIFKENEL